MSLKKIAVGVAIILVVVLIVQQMSEPRNLIDNLGTLAQVTLVGALVGSSAFYSYRGQGTVAIRNLLLWLAIIGVVALAYQYRGSFGF